ncbi:MAG: secretin N-terminal domain-containing protein [Planctomycetota bacterium]
MNERIKKLLVYALLVLVTGICRSAEPPDGNTAAIGRDDPFAGGFGEFGSEQINIPISTDSVPSKPPLFVQTVTLKFLNAPNLKNALAKMSSEYGSIGVDDNTNSLIICDTKENLEKILVEVKKADQTPKQIMIEVVIIDVQLKDDTEIGVDWDLLTTANKDFAYRQSLIFPNRLSIIPPDTGTIGNITAFSPVGLGGELAIINDDIRAVVNLLQQKRNVDILASPRVMVVSGQNAEIKTIQEIPYQQITQSSSGGGGASAITSTEFKEVGVTMEVKATVTDDGQILLEVKPEQSISTGTSIGGVPIIDRRQASTTLLMDDGQVVVMGGLRRQEITHTKIKVPLLGDIPLIGLLFSDDRKVVENSELIVLLSPHIYKNESVPAEAMARYNQIKEKSLLTLPTEPKPKKSSGK